MTLLNVKPHQGPQVTLPNNETISSTKSGLLPFAKLGPNARQVHIYDNLHSASLISVGRLCDDGCTVTFEKDYAHAIKDGQIILKGYRNENDELWDVPLTNYNAKYYTDTTPKSPHLNVIMPKDTSIKDLVNFLKACCFSPTKSTLLQAVKNGNFITWPGITPETITKFYEQTIPTSKGHLNQERKFLQSTKQPLKLYQHDAATSFQDAFPQDEILHRPTHNVICALIPFEARFTGYMDLTGKFPYPSSRGNQYIVVTYDYDTNAILAEPVKNRQAGEIKSAFLKSYEKLAARGAVPQLFICDNECSNNLKQAITMNRMKYQLVHPQQHRRNAAERAIQTFKHHFIAGLASTNPQFPIAEWDRLLPQAVITLNLLQNSRINPKISAYVALFGNFNFNATPMAPPGTKVLIHEKPGQRLSWDPHAVEGWYIGPSTEHYRCVKVYVPSTFSERICDTVEYFPHNIKFPVMNTNQYLKKAAADILAILNSKGKLQHPGLTIQDDLQQAISQTAQLLHRVHTPPSELSPQMPSTLPPVNPYTASLPRVRKKKKQVQPPRVIPKSQPIPQRTPPVFLPHAMHYGSPNFRMQALRHLQQQLQHQPYCFHIYNKETGKKETIETLRSGKDAHIWDKAVSNEFGRLAQGNVHGVTATDTIEFISKKDIPHNKKVTYGSYRFDHRPLKPEPNRC